MHVYSTLLCIAVHPKRFTIMWGGGGGSLLNHHQWSRSRWISLHYACSRDLCVPFFKYSNVVYNVGASGIRSRYAEYLNLFWKRVCAVHFHDHTHTLCLPQILVSPLRICWVAQTPACSCQASLIILDLWDQLFLHAGLPSPCFFHRIWLLLNGCHRFIFPSEISHKLHLTEMLVLKHFAVYDTTLMDFYMNCSSCWHDLSNSILNRFQEAAENTSLSSLWYCQCYH